MRVRFIIQLVSCAAIAATGAIRMKSRATAVDLQARLAVLTFDRNTSRALTRKRDRLRSALTEATLRREAAATASSPATASVSSLPLREWRSSREWRNEGQSTACGTVATLLWAAAGGDVPAMESTLAFDEDGRNQAQALFDSLPAAVRQAFPTPEAMIASRMIVAVPTGAAQLGWLQERDASHATVGLLLARGDQTAPTEARGMTAKGDRPATPVDNRATKLIVLSLERSSLGWRVVVPTTAIERLALPAR